MAIKLLTPALRRIAGAIGALHFCIDRAFDPARRSRTKYRRIACLMLHTVSVRAPLSETAT